MENKKRKLKCVICKEIIEIISDESIKNINIICNECVKLAFKGQIGQIHE